MAFGGIRKGNKVSAEAARFVSLGNLVYLGQTGISFLTFLSFFLFSSQPLRCWVRTENVPIRGVWSYPT